MALEKIINTDSLYFGKDKINKIIDFLLTLKINPESTSFIGNDYAYNSQNVTNGILEVAKGTITKNDRYKTTNYIKVDAGDTISLSAHRAYAFYDINKNFISGVYNETGAGIANLTVPANALYLRISIGFAGVDSFVYTTSNTKKSYSLVNNINLSEKLLQEIYKNVLTIPEYKETYLNVFNINSISKETALSGTTGQAKYDPNYDVLGRTRIGEKVTIKNATLNTGGTIYLFVYKDLTSDGKRLTESEYTVIPGGIEFLVPEGYHYFDTPVRSHNTMYFNENSQIITKTNNAEFLKKIPLDKFVTDSGEFVKTIDLATERVNSDNKYLLKTEVVGGTSGAKLERPANGIVNFKVNINTNIHDTKSKTLDVQDKITELTDDAILFLPTNYTATGRPIQLIINCHGAGTYITPTTTYLSQPVPNLLKLGYAVVDVNGIPSSISGETGLHFGSHYAIQSYIKAYKYAIENYNVSKEVFVIGTSMGGLTSNTLVQTGVLPVKAQGNFCPVVDHFKQAWSNPWSSGQRQKIAQYFGFEGVAPTFTATGVPTAEENAYYKANIDKVIGYYPMINDTMNWDNTYLNNIADSVEDTNYNKLIKYHQIPIKIWHNADDATVLPRYSKYYIDAIRRAGGVAYYREFPSGSHNAWDNGKTADLIDVNGVAFTATASTIELYAWLKRWE